MIALVDCNSFYASCERIFDHIVRNSPVVVLSNNDGCIVALTPEVKKLGIKRGQPYFQVKRMLKQHRVMVFSSNYTLYHSISQRIMSILSEYTHQMEEYSIDEAWLNFSKTPGRIDTAIKIRHHILQGVKIPVSIGIAPTKTLAKVANKLSKNSEFGVLELSQQEHIDAALVNLPVGDIWGVGIKLQHALSTRQIYTAAQLRALDLDEARCLRNVTLVRTIRELRGESCIELETIPTPKGIMVKRAFGYKVNNKHEIGEALCKYAAEAAIKLRSSQLVAKQMTIIIETATDDFSIPSRIYNRRITFPYPTDSTIEFNKYALQTFEKIYVKDKYRRAGIFLENLFPKSEMQVQMFGHAKTMTHETLMKVMDGTNLKFGKDVLRLASTGIDRHWLANSALLSQTWTTKWSHIPKVK